MTIFKSNINVIKTFDDPKIKSHYSEVSVIQSYMFMHESIVFIYNGIAIQTFSFQSEESIPDSHQWKTFTCHPILIESNPQRCYKIILTTLWICVYNLNII